jgi:flavodoxin
MSTRGGIDNFTYVVLEDMVYQDKKSMLKREQYFFTLHNPQLNTKKCSIGDMTKKEYHQLYYKDHREQIRAQKAKWGAVKITCACGTIVCRGGLFDHRKSKKHRNQVDETT